MTEGFIKKEGYKVLYVLGTPYQAERIVLKDNTITGFANNKSEWQFPNISNMEDFKLEDGQVFDIEVDEIAQLKISQAEQFELILEFIGGM